MQNLITTNKKEGKKERDVKHYSVSLSVFVSELVYVCVRYQQMVVDQLKYLFQCQKNTAENLKLGLDLHTSSIGIVQYVPPPPCR